MDEPTKWVTFKDDSGWFVVVPESDIAPHGHAKVGETDVELAGFDCPCGPRVDWQNSMIIHNSFAEREKTQDAFISIGI